MTNKISPFQKAVATNSSRAPSSEPINIKEIEAIFERVMGEGNSLATNEKDLESIQRMKAQIFARSPEVQMQAQAFDKEKPENKYALKSLSEDIYNKAPEIYKELKHLNLKFNVKSLPFYKSDFEPQRLVLSTQANISEQIKISQIIEESLEQFIHIFHKFLKQKNILISRYYCEKELMNYRNMGVEITEEGKVAFIKWNSERSDKVASFHIENFRNGLNLLESDKLLQKQKSFFEDFDLKIWLRAIKDKQISNKQELKSVVHQFVQNDRAGLLRNKLAMKKSVHYVDSSLRQIEEAYKNIKRACILAKKLGKDVTGISTYELQNFTKVFAEVSYQNFMQELEAERPQKLTSSSKKKKKKKKKSKKKTETVVQRPVITRAGDLQPQLIQKQIGQKTVLGYHYWSRRWFNIEDVRVIKTFKDIPGKNRYTEAVSLEALIKHRDEHNIQGIHRFFENQKMLEEFSYTYNYQGESCRGFFAQMTKNEESFPGIISVGYDRGKGYIFHAKFDPKLAISSGKDLGMPVDIQRSSEEDQELMPGPVSGGAWSFKGNYTFIVNKENQVELCYPQTGVSFTIYSLQ